ncbi:MAG TPA: SDR family NAD(P)-dependent oxidoreductase [Anaerolineae bacterium]|nr:SDR family NAD(P)-dependent oxidoreductase [Anaerolineae bacterium]HQH37031.1 SDR family NAD(P)-dependent oxidoreductase [Anaerolineae bacterium]
MKIVVTGGAGFIGSHVVDAYVAAGHEVIVMDSLWEEGGGRLKNLNPQARFYQLDIRSAEAADVIVRERPDILNHHAAQHSVKISTDKPKLDADVNVVGLINLLEACVEAQTRKVIFAGSGASYGTVDHLPINESTPQRPESPYGITKMVTEHYLRYYQQAKGLGYTIFRYGNVYGPRQDPNGEAGVIAIFAHRILTGQDVRIDWDGEQQKDYVYVGDVAAANVRALSAGDNDVFCIASERGTSVNELYRELCDIIGRDVNVIRAPRRPGDIYRSYFDCSKARKVLGWQPRQKLREGLQKVVDALRE